MQKHETNSSLNVLVLFHRYICIFCSTIELSTLIQRFIFINTIYIYTIYILYIYIYIYYIHMSTSIYLSFDLSIYLSIYTYIYIYIYTPKVALKNSAFLNTIRYYSLHSVLRMNKRKLNKAVWETESFIYWFTDWKLLRQGIL